MNWHPDVVASATARRSDTLRHRSCPRIGQATNAIGAHVLVPAHSRRTREQRRCTRHQPPLSERPPSSPRDRAHRAQPRERREPVSTTVLAGAMPSVVSDLPYFHVPTFWLRRQAYFDPDQGRHRISGHDREPPQMAGPYSGYQNSGGAGLAWSVIGHGDSLAGLSRESNRFAATLGRSARTGQSGRPRAGYGCSIPVRKRRTACSYRSRSCFQDPTCTAPSKTSYRTISGRSSASRSLSHTGTRVSSLPLEEQHRNRERFDPFKVIHRSIIDPGSMCCHELRHRRQRAPQQLSGPGPAASPGRRSAPRSRGRDCRGSLLSRDPPPPSGTRKLSTIAPPMLYPARIMVHVPGYQPSSWGDRAGISGRPSPLVR